MLMKTVENTALAAERKKARYPAGYQHAPDGLPGAACTLSRQLVPFHGDTAQPAPISDDVTPVTAGAAGSG